MDSGKKAGVSCVVGAGGSVKNTQRKAGRNALIPQKPRQVGPAECFFYP